MANLLPSLVQELLVRGSSFNPETDIPDLKGKVVAITGGMSSLHHLSLLPTLTQSAH